MSPWPVVVPPLPKFDPGFDPEGLSSSISHVRFHYASWDAYKHMSVVVKLGGAIYH